MAVNPPIVPRPTRPYSARLLRARNKPRACDGCGQTYARRNLVEAWEKQNPGHRRNWLKRKLKICVRCGPAPFANQVLQAASLIVRKKERTDGNKG